MYLNTVAMKGVVKLSAHKPFFRSNIKALDFKANPQKSLSFPNLPLLLATSDTSMFPQL